MQRGKIEIIDDELISYRNWMDVEKLLGEDVSEGTTTYNGFQVALSNNMKIPSWHSRWFNALADARQKIGKRVKSSWVIDYDVGGYQDPHIHASSQITLILNIVGIGKLKIGDDIVTLSSGDYVYFPGNVIHQSFPSETKRSILVIDFVD
jgi:mannose-6-phosphate isomerase-like protein (cupin superfamily)